MAGNSFGQLFRITTWGESHGQAMGVVIDGCPAGLAIEESEINKELVRRAPGKSGYTSLRKEKDEVVILSGIFEGKTTGAPISLLIHNQDGDSTKYEPIKTILRPGHANYTYLEKYGVFDHRGGGRASARETVCRVAAGAIAKKLLHEEGIEIIAYIKQIGPIKTKVGHISYEEVQKSSLFCPDPLTTLAMEKLLEKAKEEGDSWGGIVAFLATGLPVGLGDPVYEKLEARLGFAMMSLPASKGFEMGSGFGSVAMRGSEHNDRFIDVEGAIRTGKNDAGGTLGGISSGMPLWGSVAFKPTSSIMKSQETVTVEGEKTLLELPPGSRHDPCVAIRAVPVVEAMVALVLADALLTNRSARMQS